MTKNVSILVSEKKFFDDWFLQLLRQLLALTLLDHDPGTRVALLGAERLHLFDHLPAVAVFDPPEDNMSTVQPAEKKLTEHL